MEATPFARYLKKTGKTAAEVGRKMAVHLGASPSSASLSQWANGVAAPGAAAQIAMDKATRGDVTPGDWAKWRAHQ